MLHSKRIDIDIDVCSLKPSSNNQTKQTKTKSKNVHLAWNITPSFYVQFCMHTVSPDTWHQEQITRCD